MHKLYTLRRRGGRLFAYLARRGAIGVQPVLLKQSLKGDIIGNHDNKLLTGVGHLLEKRAVSKCCHFNHLTNKVQSA